MTVIGPMNGMLFLYYLVRSLALQIIPSTLGRIQTFAIMKAKDYAVCIFRSRFKFKSIFGKIDIRSGVL